MIKKILILVLIALATSVFYLPATASDVITGKVVETMNSGGYTYILLKSGGKDIWVAAPLIEKQIVAGKTMKFRPGMTMTNFESKTLNRTFDSIIFSEGIETGSGQKPVTAPSVGRAQPSAFSGKVLETMDSGGYTYVRINMQGRKQWVAVPQSGKKITKGQVLSFGPGGEMKDFESKTLKRKFDSIIFSDGIIENSGSGKGDKRSQGRTETAKVYTLAELMADKKKFNHKNVVVKGKITKASREIMERNWYHFQDGSSDPEKGVFDVMVTSQDSASAGDEVTVTGMFFEEKDYGAGYKFTGIIENAAIKKSGSPEKKKSKTTKEPKAAKGAKKAEEPKTDSPKPSDEGKK